MTATVNWITIDLTDASSGFGTLVDSVHYNIEYKIYDLAGNIKDNTDTGLDISEFPQSFLQADNYNPITNVKYDLTRPTVTLSYTGNPHRASADFATATPDTITADFGETVYTVYTGQRPRITIVLADGTNGATNNNMERVEGQTPSYSKFIFPYTIPTVADNDDIDGVATVTISNAIDHAGNENISTPIDNTNTFIIDSAAPTIASISTGQGNNPDYPFYITVTFDDNIEVGNGNHESWLRKYMVSA